MRDATQEKDLFRKRVACGLNIGILAVFWRTRKEALGLGWAAMTEIGGAYPALSSHCKIIAGPKHSVISV
jgi:hypothetical protein